MNHECIVPSPPGTGTLSSSSKVCKEAGHGWEVIDAGGFRSEMEYAARSVAITGCKKVLSLLCEHDLMPNLSLAPRTCPLIQ